LIDENEYLANEEYKRHEFTKSGVSPRAIPGTKGAIIRTNADEHDQFGYTTEDPVLTTKMNNKRMKKLDLLSKELENYETVNFYGPEDSDAMIIGWGSTKGPILEAMKLLNKEGNKVNYLQIVYLHPFPVKKVKEFIESAKKTIVVENNMTSQLSSLIQELLLTKVDNEILRYDGRPFNPTALSQRIKEVL
jgi:2-oxoglutarate ferredoxin oxidoreductase subunit alpha